MDPRGTGLLIALCLSAGCSPAAFSKLDDGSSALDGGSADLLGRDLIGTDRRIGPVDGSLDAAGLDGTIGPRIDGGSLRDTGGVDGTIGPRLDAAGQDLRVPPPGSQSCRIWQDCAPHFGDANSGYECVNQLCVCDPTNQMMTTCTTGGGQWLGQECFCVWGADPMPTTDAGYPDCWWSWHQDSCEPDYWVDTSYQVEECYCCDEYGYDICEWRWIYQGYWEDGYCPAGWWEEVCY